ncbi:hypothetical protein AAFF_G00027830 [Aldrovandia affinis]|uniref:Shadow of prion protein n=1 Tax=Aldrovandia affinis TaxID=143900 RepID=A0AAD7S4N7_9TELE|nr:hypothetical protein AAFF_G00027830 [Aldrovandia affinis]
MIGQHRLLLLWVAMLLVAILCPGAQSKRGGGARPSQSRGSSRLKLAGAAAAGALGGAALGYGLGSLGRPSYGYGYGGDSSKEDRRLYYADGPGYWNQSDLRYYRGASSSGPLPRMPLVLGSVVSMVLGSWIRGV